VAAFICGVLVPFVHLCKLDLQQSQLNHSVCWQYASFIFCCIVPV